MVSPTAVYSKRLVAPIAPTKTSPVLMPTRTLKSSPRSRASSSCNSAMPATISRPAITARLGSSSCAAGAPKKARIESPISRATVPSWRVTGEIRWPIARFMIPAQSSGSNRPAISVEPLMSENRTVTTRRSPVSESVGEPPSSRAASLSRRPASAASTAASPRAVRWPSNAAMARSSSSRSLTVPPLMT